MKAAFLDAGGRPFVKGVGSPSAEQGEVVVQVTMSAIHHGNLVGEGERALGIEAVGVVVEASPPSELSVGQRVGIFPAWGTVREVIALPRANVFALNERLPDEAAAQLFVNPLSPGRQIDARLPRAGMPPRW